MTRLGKIGQNAQLAILGLLPIAALFGNAAADIALVLTVIIYLSTERDAFRELRQSRFFQLAFIFWIWICICSAVSLFPKNSFQDSLPWIRFPLFAFALGHFLADQSDKKYKVFIGFTLLGTLIEICFIVVEYLSKTGSYQHLYGTMIKPVADWYIIGFGLIGSLISLSALRKQNTLIIKKISAILFLLLCAIALILTQAIMNSILFFSIMVFYCLLISLTRNEGKYYSILTAFLIIFSCIILIIYVPSLNQRANLILTRLPWLNESDFYPIWTGSLHLINNNPIFGIGPKNTFLFTSQLEKEGTLFTSLGIQQVLWHSHNLYLQVIVEAGIIGLVFFVATVNYLIYQAIKLYVQSRFQYVLAISTLPILFFPIQTYSQAFGQFRNFFLWLTVGFIIASMRKRDPLNKI